MDPSLSSNESRAASPVATPVGDVAGQSTPRTHRAFVLLNQEGDGLHPVQRSSFQYGSRMNPEVIRINSIDELPFANGNFLITRNSTVKPARITISTTISPTEYKCWAAVSPPEEALFHGVRMEFELEAVRSVVVKGTRVNHFMQQYLEAKEKQIEDQEKKCLEMVTDRTRPHLSDYYWLIVFPSELVLNNTSSQKFLDRTIVGKSTLMPTPPACRPGWSPIRCQAKAAIVGWSIDEMDPNPIPHVCGENLSEEEIQRHGF